MPSVQKQHSLLPFPFAVQNVYLANFDTRAMDDIITINIVAAMQTLSQMGPFSQCPFLLVMEDRPQGTPGTVFREVRRNCGRLRITALHGSGPTHQRVPGVPIDNKIKREMTNLMASLLRNKRVRYSINACTASGDLIKQVAEQYIQKSDTCAAGDAIRRTLDETEWQSYEELRKECHEQMSRWEEFVEETGPQGARTTKFFYSGKGASGNLNDDMAITAAMGPYHVGRWRETLKRQFPAAS